MDNNKEVIDLCSSSSSSEDEVSSNNGAARSRTHISGSSINQRRRRTRHVRAASSSSSSAAVSENNKRAKMAAAAEARQKQRPQPQPNQQHQRQHQHQHQHLQYKHEPAISKASSSSSSAPSSSSSPFGASSRHFSTMIQSSATNRKPKPPPPPPSSAPTRTTATATASTSTPTCAVPTEPLVFLNAHGRENAVVTTGIGKELANYKLGSAHTASSTNNKTMIVATCCSGNSNHHQKQQRAAKMPSRSSLSSSPSPSRRRRVLTLQHVQQLDKWSCGFCNLQMLLMAMVPHLEPSHAYFQFNPSSTSISTSTSTSSLSSFCIPSLPQLELALEAAWKNGLDTKGRDHYHGKISNKRVWIGAVEVWSVLTYWSIDACVVQFIQTAASRRQLGSFVLAYFTKQHVHQYHQQEDDEDDDSCCCMFCTNQHPLSMPSTHAMASKLLAIASGRQSQGAQQRRQQQRQEQQHGRTCCLCPILPLYLQWKGHSVTVIGVEYANNNSYNNNINNSQGEPVNLLILDPSNDGQAIQSSLARGNLTKVRYPLRKLESQDVQVILTSTAPLRNNLMERELHMARGRGDFFNVVTAA